MEHIHSLPCPQDSTACLCPAAINSVLYTNLIFAVSDSIVIKYVIDHVFVHIQSNGTG